VDKADALLVPENSSEISPRGEKDIKEMPNRPGQGLGHGLDVGMLPAQHHIRLTDTELPQEFTGQPGMLTRINQVERLPAFLELLKDGRHFDELCFCADKDMNHVALHGA
jgi:hypothetical protein